MKDQDTVKVKVNVCTNKLRSTDSKVFEFDKAEWDEMDDIHRSDACFELADPNMMFQVDYEELE